MRISDWSSDVCSSDLDGVGQNLQDHVDYVACFETPGKAFMGRSLKGSVDVVRAILRWKWSRSGLMTTPYAEAGGFLKVAPGAHAPDVQLHFVIAPLEDHGRVAVKAHGRSEEHTTELQSLMRNSYAALCLK